MDYIVGLVIVAVVAVGVALKWQGEDGGREGERRRSGTEDARPPAPRISTDGVEPEAPRAFGYKCIWLAIRTGDPHRVVAALGLDDVRPVGWRAGLEAAYAMDGRVFVTPALGEWVLAISTSLPRPGGGGHPDQATPLLLELGKQFDEVQYFLTHRTVDYHAWARVRRGEVDRAYGWAEGGEVVWDRGEQTDAERRLGLRFFDEAAAEAGAEADGDRENLRYPDEEDVLRLAAEWSVDPTFQRGTYAPGVGFVGALGA